MQHDPRITAALALAQQRSHPYYAAAAYTLARQCGDTRAMQEALSLGAANYVPAARVYARTEATVVQLTMFEEAA